MADPNPLHTYARGHNGCCKTCVGIMEKTATSLDAHIVEENGTLGEIRGKLGLLVELVKWGMVTGAGVVVARVVYLLWPA